MDPQGVQMLLGALDDGVLSREVVVALERQLCSQVPSGQEAQLLQDPSCFQLLLRSLELLGTEKAVSLSILRWVQGPRGAVGPPQRVWECCWWCWGQPVRVCGSCWGCSSLGHAHPSTQAGAGWSVLGHGATWGHSSCAWLLLLGTRRGSRGRAWVLVGCARSQGSLACRSLRGGAGQQGCLQQRCPCAPG